MASIYKTFNNDDITTITTLLHESIPIPGSIVSGTYNDLNILNFSHDMWQAVYDYPYNSSSANHIFDITVGHHTSSTTVLGSDTLNKKKTIIYNTHAQRLMGYDVTGSIKQFSHNANDTAPYIKEGYFIDFSRLLVKDEIKKGSFQIVLGVGSWNSPTDTLITVSDAGAASDYKVDSPAGEYAILSSSNSGSTGLIFYQAGIALIGTSSFVGGNGVTDWLLVGSQNRNIATAISSSAVSASANAFRRRLSSLQFNNTTELHSTIYFCRVNHNEGNYTSNPTALSSSKLVVKQTANAAPVTFITSVGGFSADNELLWVAKLSEPIRKDPTTELTLRVRTDWVFAFCIATKLLLSYLAF